MCKYIFYMVVGKYICVHKLEIQKSLQLNKILWHFIGLVKKTTFQKWDKDLLLPDLKTDLKKCWFQFQEVGLNPPQKIRRTV